MVTISTIGQRRGAGLRAARRRGLDVAVAGASLGGGDSASTGEVTWWKDGLEYVVWLMFIVVLLVYCFVVDFYGIVFIFCWFSIHLYGLCRFLLELDDVVFRISYILWTLFLFCLEL